MKVRTRFAPSPTGFLHIGGLRTALYSYALAKSQGGKFILRIEDTDQDRVVPGATEKIYLTLRRFGIVWDEGPEVGGPHSPYVQSERVKLGIYQKYAQKLLEEGHAYYCFCPPKSEEEIKADQQKKVIQLRDQCRNLTKQEVERRLNSGQKAGIRLRVPEDEKVSFFDFVVKKEISWETANIDEVMLLKSDGFPTYHLAVTVDDAEMQISHVLRGHDWLPSTPVHLLLFKYLGFPLPKIGHLTDILDPEGGKLSKRKGAVSAEEMLSEGYLPEAILNFIMLLGWAPKDNREIFSLQEFVDNFQKGNLQIANPVFNRQKLDWFNGYYLRQKSDQELTQILKTYLSTKKDTFYAPTPENESKLARVVPLIKDRIVKLSDFDQISGFLFTEPKIDPSLFGDFPYREHVSKAIPVLKKVAEWDNENIQNALLSLIAKENWK
ncbi:MAG: glutamate--tRNA ligase, partial [Microgenomates group bacterium]